jgi:hypothetical protein
MVVAALTAAPTRAFAEGPGPAYLIEPGEAPENSVPMEPTDPSAMPAEVPPEESGAPNAVETEAPPTGSYEEGTPYPDPGAAPAVSDEDPRALTEFGPRLDPYGTWKMDPSYGQVWVPDFGVVGSGFSPYLSDGHWAVDASGAQTWASDYPFGDVVFHYGRWVWTAGGWAWVPGYRYAPAWVAWRLPTDNYGYFGWAPLPPSFVWMNRSAVGIGWRSSYYWVFCPSAFVHTPTPSSYVVRSPAEAQGIARHTRTYVPASPYRSSAPREAAAGVPRQQWAPGYRPAGRVASRPAAVAPSTTTASAPRPRPRPMAPRTGTPMMHAAPARAAAPSAAPRVVNASMPMRANGGAVFRGGRR